MTKRISMTQKIELLLEEIANSKKYPSNVIQRAKILLLSKDYNNCEIADRLQISRKSVGKWKNKYYDRQQRILEKAENLSTYSLRKYLISFLTDSPRSGKPCKYSTDQINLIIHYANSDPKSLTKEYKSWSLDKLVSFLNENLPEIDISKTTIWRIFKKEKFKISSNKYWK